ncbi:MAG TPA: hypothetical protein VHV30_01520, partial [Polyangiaceae bacterium]|nr:hypothetical protein [Polyangiaceae bacterium]
YACVVLLLTIAGVARAGYARLAEGQLAAGRDLGEVGDVLGTTKTILVNGAVMNISTAGTDLTPGEVLDRFEAVCEAHPQIADEAMADIAGTLKADAPGRPALLGLSRGVIRKEANGEGALTCFTGDTPLSFHQLSQRIEAFLESRDLSAFGHPRYVYVQRKDSGHTFVRTVWTDGPLNLGTMFPATGDAAGFDSPIVPRPPGSRRTFSIRSAQVPYTINIYESTEPEAALRAFYAQAMPERGWRVYVDQGATVVYGEIGGAVYLTFTSKDGRNAVVASSTVGIDTPRLAVAHVNP